MESEVAELQRQADDLSGLITRIISRNADAVSRFKSSNRFEPDSTLTSSRFDDGYHSNNQGTTNIEMVSYINGVITQLEFSRTQLLDSKLADDQQRVLGLSNQIQELQKTVEIINARGQIDLEGNLPVFDSKIDNEEIIVGMFKSLDAGGNSDGTVSFDELQALIELKETENEIKSKLSQVIDVLSKAFGFRLHEFTELLMKFEVEASSFGKFRQSTMQESICCLFKALDKDGDDLLSDADLKSSLSQENSNPIESSGIGQDVLRILRELRPLQRSLDYPKFKEAVQRVPRIKGERTTFASSLGLDSCLARHLPPGTLLDGLAGLKRGFDEDSLGPIVDVFAAEVKRRLAAELRRLGAAEEAAGGGPNCKFEGFEGDFASLEDFYRGAEESLSLGYPDPDILRGIELEHTAHPSVGRAFVTPNYLIATDLQTEWAWLRFRCPGSPSEAVERFLAEIRVSHGNEEDGLFPGEVGDRFHEVLVVASVRVGPTGPAGALTPAGMKAALDRKAHHLLATKYATLETREDLARGIRVLDRAESEAHLHSLRCGILKGAAAQPLDPWPPADLIVGLVLPVSPARFEAARPRVEACVAECIGGGAACRVETLEAVHKRFTFERYADVSTLRQVLSKLHLAELRSVASSQWGVSLPVAGAADERCALTDRVVHAFITQELQRDFRAAIRAASPSDEQLDAAMTSWGVDCNNGRNDRINRLVEALNTEKRAKEVAQWIARSCVRLQGRIKVSIADVMSQQKAKIEAIKLQEAEVITLVSYTGPSFVISNAIFRGFPRRILDLLEGDFASGPNRMPTTLFCTMSGLVKVSRCTEIPAGGKVYRGLGKMLLPQNFWVPRGVPAWRGGVERAIMSTTTSKAVALHYSGGRGTVCELELGRIHIGGETGWLSQYPLEEELTLPPFTCLEANGEPRMEKTPAGELVIFPLKANINPKISTVEELQSRRKTLHCGNAALLRRDLVLQGKAALQNFLDTRGHILEVVCGLPGQVHIDHSTNTVTFFDWGFGPSVGAPSSCRGLKAIYFELKIMSEFRGAGLAVGIAGTNFPSYYNLVREWSSCFAHLNTSVSWLARCSNRKLNGGYDDKFEPEAYWKKGDILGLACDVENGTLQISVNGGSFVKVFSSGVSTGPAVGSDLFPIMAGERGLQIRLNLGTNPLLSFQHAPPDFRYVMEPLRAIAESLTSKNVASALFVKAWNTMRTEIIGEENALLSSLALLKQEYARLGESEISSVHECWESRFKSGSLTEFSEKNAQFFGGTVPQANLILVPRESERRCIFLYSDELRAGKTMPLTFRTPSSAIEMGVSGTNLQQKYENDYWIESVICPPPAALLCHFETNFLLFEADMRLLDIRGWNYNAGVRLGIFRNLHNPQETFKKGGGRDFVLNEDCTISPTNAGHLVLGISFIEDDACWFRIADTTLSCGLALLRGDPAQTRISPSPESETCTVCFGGADVSVVGAPFLAAPTGQDLIAFEVELLSVGSDPFLAIGFAGSFFNFSHKSGSWFLELVSSNRTAIAQVEENRKIIEHIKQGDVIALRHCIKTGALAAYVNGMYLSSEKTAFKHMLSGPSVGTRLYPIIEAKNVQLRCNLGTDLKSSPFKYPNPITSEGYKAFPFLSQSLTTSLCARKVNLAGHNQNLERLCSDLREKLISELDTNKSQLQRSCLSQPELVSLGLDAESMLAVFNKVVDDHDSLDTIEFNNDACYRRIFNELLDTKQCLLNKQAALFLMLRDGATLKQVQPFSEAPCSDFKQPQYSNDPCRVGYTWASLLSGWMCSSMQVVVIPLSLPPCQIAVIWEAINGAVKAGALMDRVKLGDEILPASSTFNSLSLIPHRLNFIKYEAALAALISIETMSVLDETGNDFAPDGQMSHSIRQNKSITSLNRLSLTRNNESDGGNVSQILTRSGESVQLEKLTSLERVFVMARVHEHRWTSINLDNCQLTASAAAVLLNGQLPFIQTLSLSSNKLAGGEGLKRLSERFSNLAGLTDLDLAANQFSSGEMKTLASGLSWLVNLISLNLEANAFGAEGMSSLVRYSFPHLQHLEDLNLTDCKILEEGAISLATGLRHITRLRALMIHANLIRASGAMILAKEGLCHVPSLSRLCLGYNELGADGIQQFLDEGIPLLPNLSVLQVFDNEINGAPNEITPEVEARFHEQCRNSYPSLALEI